VTVSLEIGPILRASVRQKSAFVVVVLQLASSYTVVACLLMAGTWMGRMGHAPLGFEQQDLIAVRSRTAHDPAAPSRGEGLRTAQLARLGAVPDVQGVARLWPALADADSTPSRFRTPGPDRSPTAGVMGWSAYASADIVRVLGLHVLQGTAAAAPGTVIITRSLREALFGQGPALQGMVSADDGPPAAVVGVVEDVQLREGYWPFARALAFRFLPPPDLRGEILLVRAAPGQQAAVLAAVTAALGPAGPAHALSVEALTAQSWPLTRTTDGIRTVLALVGLSVAAIALLGALAVASFVVAERRRTIGIRRAIGATRWDIFRYFLVESSIAAALGTGLGLCFTLALVGATRDSLPSASVSAGHLVVTAVFLWLIASVAAVVPARRAARLSPSLAAQRSR
jgi:putative ABC transport system permease protein